MANLRTVKVVVTNKKTGETYHARSYPDADYDNNGMIELYGTPVYKVLLTGTDAQGRSVTKEWKALRFMPYWNDRRNPNTHYTALGWVNSGKHAVALKYVTYFNPDYMTRNRVSPYSGAIQIDGSFLVHAGPRDISDRGWGAAGCVEVIGDFGEFKKELALLAGATGVDSSADLLEMVKQKKLMIEVEHAIPPDLKNNFIQEVSP